MKNIHNNINNNINNKLIYKCFSILLCYPEQELLDNLPELKKFINQNNINLDNLFNYLENNSLRTLQENYVAIFDRNRHHALYIFEHVYGEDRDRGSAMVDLLEEYRKHGFELGDDELPDYLPALLEFFSQIDWAISQKLLGDAVHVIHHIAQKLNKNHQNNLNNLNNVNISNYYADLLNEIVKLSPVAPQALIEPPVRDMDEAMETFAGSGLDIAGTEPLLQPNKNLNQNNILQFYPKNPKLNNLNKSGVI